MTGYDKKVEAKILDLEFINITNFEQNIIDNLDMEEEKMPEVFPQTTSDVLDSSMQDESTNTCSG